MTTNSEQFVSADAEHKLEAVFEYRNRTRGEAILCDREASFVERFLKLDDFILPFGGYISLIDSETGQAYLGVWGRRNARRFRRMLRERGAKFVLVRRDQPGRRVLHWHTFPTAYHGNLMTRKHAE